MEQSGGRILGSGRLGAATVMSAACWATLIAGAVLAGVSQGALLFLVGLAFLQTSFMETIAMSIGLISKPVRTKPLRPDVVSIGCLTGVVATLYAALAWTNPVFMLAVALLPLAIPASLVWPCGTNNNNNNNNNNNHLRTGAEQ